MSMVTYHAPLTDFHFVLDEFLEIDRYRELSGFGELLPELRADLLAGAAKICEETLLPLNASGDRTGCQFQNGRVFTPAKFVDAYRAFVAGGWMTVTFDPAYGGQGLAYLISVPLKEMLVSANMAFSGYIDITQAAATCLATHATSDQKHRYLSKLTAGEWAGAMHLTEAHAGSDLGLMRTRAEPGEDGSYRLYGSKIFITGADHDLTENIVSLVLARLPGPSQGARGLSLFIVPSVLVDAQGRLAARNAVQVVSIEEKMGIHASPTCAVAYEGAVGELVGEPHRGLAVMFTMLNQTRLGVALQGLGISEIAWQNAFAYARERRQGRRPGAASSPNGPADLIVDHPDIRRMLLTIKAFNEAARALALWCGLQIDLARSHPDAAIRRQSANLMALLTPVLKAYNTDRGFENANLAMQCFGGHGYIVDTGVEQFVRDIRVAQIYEGTNGIQALELAQRQLGIDDGKTLQHLFGLMRSRLSEAHAVGLADYANVLEAALNDLNRTADWIGSRRITAALDVAAGASDFLRLFALTVMGWTWTGLAISALRCEKRGGDPRFCREKIATGRFFMARLAAEAGMYAKTVVLGGETLDNVFALAKGQS